MSSKCEIRRHLDAIDEVVNLQEKRLEKIREVLSSFRQYIRKILKENYEKTLRECLSHHIEIGLLNMGCLITLSAQSSVSKTINRHTEYSVREQAYRDIELALGKLGGPPPFPNDYLATETHFDKYKDILFPIQEKVLEELRGYGFTVQVGGIKGKEISIKFPRKGSEEALPEKYRNFLSEERKRQKQIEEDRRLVEIEGNKIAEEVVKNLQHLLLERIAKDIEARGSTYIDVRAFVVREVINQYNFKNKHLFLTSMLSKPTCLSIRKEITEVHKLLTERGYTAHRSSDHLHIQTLTRRKND